MLLGKVGFIFSELGEGSSLHGLPKIISSKQVAIKIFWAVIVVGASILLGLQLTALYEEFTRYPTKTSIKVEYGPIEFPAVTVCNMNPLKLTKIGYFPNVAAVLSRAKTNGKSETPNRLNVNDDTTSETPRRQDSSTVQNSPNRNRERSEGGRPSPTDSSNHARPSEEPLSHVNIDPVLSPEHGTCYTINVDRNVESAGPNSGLDLVLFLDKQEYLEEVMDGYGIKVIVHERGTFPMPTEEGLEINPGYLTDVAMKRKTIDRYGPPYGDCVDEKDFKGKYGIEYSIPVCYALCRLETIWSECGCVPYTAPELIDVQTDRNICPWRGSCIERITEEMKERPSSCGCFAKCDEHVYQSRFTSRRWPNPTYLQSSIYASACNRNIPSLNKLCDELGTKRLNITEENYKEYSEDFAGLRIFYETLVYETVVEEPLYSTITFLSDVGGSMGFFLGASLITYLELVHLLVELLICFYKHFSRRSTAVCPDKPPNACELSEEEIS